MSDAIEYVLASIKRRLRSLDIRRSDVRFGPLLSRMPERYSTLSRAMDAARADPAAAVATGLLQVFSELDEQLRQLAKLSLEQQLIVGTRPLLASERDAACLTLLMGWIDGQLCAPEDVAAEFSTSVEHVLWVERQVHEKIKQNGFTCPKLSHMLEKAVNRSGAHDQWLKRELKALRYSDHPWEVRTLIACADLLDIQTGLNLMEVGGTEFLTLLADEHYPQRVIDRALDLLVVNGHASIEEIAEHVAAQINQPVKAADARIVVATMRNIRWIDAGRSVFTFK